MVASRINLVRLRNWLLLSLLVSFVLSFFFVYKRSIYASSSLELLLENLSLSYLAELECKLLQLPGLVGRVHDRPHPNLFAADVGLKRAVDARGENIMIGDDFKRFFLSK
eukprot:GHVT01087349.1.p1 GENE.GHVT01087349.1~~GHVT01087349.1.p1  ORF type:complete len:110 (-),score=13.26 GHVT01087349.1:564-893(-)